MKTFSLFRECSQRKEYISLGPMHTFIQTAVNSQFIYKMIPFLITSVYGKMPNLWGTMGRSY